MQGKDASGCLLAVAPSGGLSNGLGGVLKPSASFTSRKLSFVLGEILPFPPRLGGGNVLQIAGSPKVGS